MIGKLNAAQIEEVLHKQLIGRIGCNADGITYIVPISYAYDGESVYMHTYEGQKMEMMRKNPDVCFQVDTMNDMANWRSVIAWGAFEELKEEEERTKGLNVLLNRSLPLVSSETTHLGSLWPFQSNNVSDIDGIVFRIHLKDKTGRFENNQQSNL